MNFKKVSFFIVGAIGLSLFFEITQWFITRSTQSDSGNWIEKTVDREFVYYQKRGISRDCIEKAWSKLRKKPEFRRYKIINSHVYGKPGRIKNLLDLLVETYSVPDVDFIYFNEDRIKKSFVKRSPKKYAAPIFVSAKDITLNQFILFSDWLYDPKDHENGWNFILQKVNEFQDFWP